MRTTDEQQYHDFVVASQGRLRRTAYLLTGDWQLAADVTQEALIRVYLAWPRLERAGGLPTYARRALVSAVHDHRRRRWTREPVVEVDPGRPSGRDDTQVVDDRDLLVAGLRQLPKRQRACVVLRYFDELSVEETAAAVGCSTGTVKSQTHKGLGSLRRIFEGHGRDQLVLPDGRSSTDERSA